jgi:antitoxin ParD1/3/4
LPKIAIAFRMPSMSTMNISLPDALKSFVDVQVVHRGYGTSSEYVRELIRKDQQVQQLRVLLLAGVQSPAQEAVTLPTLTRFVRKLPAAKARASETQTPYSKGLGPARCR